MQFHFHFLKSGLLSFLLVMAFSLMAQQEAVAEKISNKVAVFSGLDKITGRTVEFDVYINETVQFGTLLITPRICYSRPPEEPQKLSTFLEVREVTLDRQIKKIFSGWMFAASPGLNAIEHAVYDVWLLDCKMHSNTPPPSATN